MKLNSEKPLKAWVLDDEKEFAEEWVEALEESGEKAGLKLKAEAFHDGKLGKFVNELYCRSRDFRAGTSHCDDSTSLDECDLLVIDSDLRSAEEVGLVSGLDLAYAARCFSDVGCIVILNAFGENPFDLTLLGHRRSFADVHLGSQQLRNPGLWKLDPGLKFRPWNWPLLQHEAKRMQERRDWLLEGRLNEPIFQLFGFEEADYEAMPRSMASYLTSVRDRRRGSTKKSLKEITVVDFLLNSEYGLSKRDAEAVEKSEGEQQLVLARTAAARLSKWLHEVLAAGQDILVDAPHVASRFPSTLSGDGIDDFNRTVQLEIEGSAEKTLKDLGFDADSQELKDHLFNLDPWPNRPLWWGQRLARSNLLEAQKPWEYEAPEVAFCEDASRFLPKADGKKFACDVETPHRIRYIAEEGDEVAYRPRENLIAD